MRRLAELLLDAQVPTRRARFPEPIDKALARYQVLLANDGIAPRAAGLLLLAGDAAASAHVKDHLGAAVLDAARTVAAEVARGFHVPLNVLLTDSIHAEAERIAERVVTCHSRSPGLLARLGRLAQQPISGALIALGVLALAYGWVGAFAATFVVDTLNVHLLQRLVYPLCARLVAPIPWAFVRDAILDPDFGLLPSGLFLAVGVVLPVLFAFYLFQAVLEDSGYIPRLAVLFDRLFRRLGLNGHGVIPLMLGFSCGTMAVITARMLPTRKERFILTLLIVGVPCAPLLAVMIVILQTMPWSATAVLFGLIVARIVVMGCLAAKLVRGTASDLILEIPRLRVPQLRVLLRKTSRRTWQFMREAVPIFLVGSFAVFLFHRAGGLGVVEHVARPLVQGVLGLPDQAVQVFIKTAIRREAGAAELTLLHGHFNNLQLVVTLLMMSFIMPCINASLVTIKERGPKAALAIFCTVVVSAVAVGAAVNIVCRGLGITFA